jgi:hypothetical protein
MFARLQFDILGNCASFYFIYEGQVHYLQHSLLQSHFVTVLYIYMHVHTHLQRQERSVFK